MQTTKSNVLDKEFNKIELKTVLNTFLLGVNYTFWMAAFMCDKWFVAEACDIRIGQIWKLRDAFCHTLISHASATNGLSDMKGAIQNAKV
jgi:hypothetical protein